MDSILDTLKRHKPGHPNRNAASLLDDCLLSAVSRDSSTRACARKSLLLFNSKDFTTSLNDKTFRRLENAFAACDENRRPCLRLLSCARHPRALELLLDVFNESQLHKEWAQAAAAALYHASPSNIASEDWSCVAEFFMSKHIVTVHSIDVISKCAADDKKERFLLGVLRSDSDAANVRRHALRALRTLPVLSNVSKESLDALARSDDLPQKLVDELLAAAP